MDDFSLGFRLFLLIGVANTAPFLAKLVCGERWTTPLDGGACFIDGRPLFGPSKTIRGVVSGILCTGIAALLLAFPASLGLKIGFFAMAGDALSSFVKRRIAIPASGRATGVDQIPEALLPLLAVREPLSLSWLQIIAITLAFFTLEPPLARLLCRLGLRDRPY